MGGFSKEWKQSDESSQQWRTHDDGIDYDDCVVKVIV
jgi:hypothetical protein